jgi:N-dimethylarginine dimethylaminohydrolase
MLILVNLCIYSSSTTIPAAGAQSMVHPLRKVLVRRPTSSFGVSDYTRWHYTATPDVDRAQQEHDAFVALLRTYGADVIYHEVDLPEHADALFVHDPACITDYGAIILKMGKPLRVGEEAALEQTLNANGIATLYTLHGNATAEGGDMLWLDRTTLAVGRGFRTNDEGIQQIKHALKDTDITVLVVDLPYDQGKDACLHLQSLMSLIDTDLALVYKKFLPVWFVHYLEQKGFKLLAVPEEEYASMAPNVLALAPKVCLTIEGNVATKKLLEDAGCTVYTYKGDEISHKAEGGATCLTRPLLRAYTS